MSNIGIKFPLPKPEFPVDRRELTVSVNGEGKTYMLPGSAMFSDEFVFADSDSYVVSLVDIDAYGNRSAASDPYHGRISDDIRPLKPGPIGPVVATSKRFMTDAEVVQWRADAANKANELAKAEAAKSDQLAKDEKARKDAHDKIDADAKAAAAKSPHSPPAPLK